MKKYRKNIILCEIGWHKTREQAVSLAQKNIPSVVLIKGLPDKDVKAMITGYKSIKNVFIPEKLFKPCAFIYLFLNILTGKPLSLFIEAKEKTYIRLECLKNIFPGIELTKLSA